MEIRRLRLLNFRQHADTELQFERGLTGIIGPNGSGKTTLLEAIAWALYGTEAARGTRDTIRRRGAPPRSRVEVELTFTLGPHGYRVVRSLNNAELYLDGEPTPIANSLGAVNERLRKLLGMNRDEFFRTYFAGQKELALMASLGPTERGLFLNRVLGYEKLRTAQNRARERKRVSEATLDARKRELVDPARLAEEEARVGARLRAAEEASARSAAAEREADAALALLRPEGERWEALQLTVLSLEGDLKVAEHGAEAARESFGRLDRELAEAVGAKTRLDALLPELAPLAALRQERDGLDAEHGAVGARQKGEVRRTELARQVEGLDQRLAQLPAAEALTGPAAARSELEAKLAQAAQDQEAARTAWVREKQDAETQRKNLLAQHADLGEQRRRLEAAGAEGDCPTCGRPLRAEYPNVMGLLERQLEEIESQGKFYQQRLKQLTKEPAELTTVVAEHQRLSQESQRLTEQAAQLTQQVGERGRVETERAGLAAEIEAVLAEIAAAPERYDEARHTEVRREIARLEPVEQQAAYLRGLAERATELVPRAAAAEQDLSQREARVQALRAELTGLGWSAERFAEVRAQLRAAERALQQAQLARARAAGELTASLEQRAELTRRKEERERRLAEIQRLGDELALQHELDRALGDLRTELNDTLRPDLSELASAFLREMTGGRYADLDLDEDYNITLLEDGEPTKVISGGEEDVANLALRLAISQMIAERAGQPFSLLVLDEVFGSLDEERRGAVVDLLRHLADRFPQVILITHIESVRDGFDRVIRLSYDVEQRTARAVLEPRDVAA